MAALTTWTGVILTVAGILAFVVTGADSVTALIPAAVGVVLLIAALVARRVPRWHRHAIHAALVVALIGVLGSLMNVVKIGDLISGEAERPAAVVVSLLMFVVLLGYLAAGARSFLVARSAR